MIEQVIIRGIDPKEDLDFIYSTWLKGQYYGHPFFRQMNKHSYFKNYQKVVEKLLGRSEIRVACLKESAQTIIGYAAIEPRVLHWVFVKDAWRKFKIARALIPSDIEYVTHITKLGLILMPKDWSFDPFRI